MSISLMNIKSASEFLYFIEAIMTFAISLNNLFTQHEIESNCLHFIVTMTPSQLKSIYGMEQINLYYLYMYVVYH